MNIISCLNVISYGYLIDKFHHQSLILEFISKILFTYFPHALYGFEQRLVLWDIKMSSIFGKSASSKRTHCQARKVEQGVCMAR